VIGVSGKASLPNTPAEVEVPMSMSVILLKLCCGNIVQKKMKTGHVVKPTPTDSSLSKRRGKPVVRRCMTVHIGVNVNRFENFVEFFMSRTDS